MPVLVKEQARAAAPARPAEAEGPSMEMVAFCPRCKAWETLWFSGDRLVRTARFYQVGGRIYHGCGSNDPCRLYRSL